MQETSLSRLLANQGDALVQKPEEKNIRNKLPEVGWWKILWFPKAISKHAFEGWLTIHNRLTTNARLMGWSIFVDTLCVLCKMRTEIEKHLFFECSFSRRKWTCLMSWCLINWKAKVPMA